MIDYIVFALIILLFLGAPGYLWFRWIKVAIINRNTISKIASISSFVFFILAIAVMWFDPQRLFERNSIRLPSSDPIVLFLFMVSFLIPLTYFYIRWVYQAVKLKKVSTILFRSSFFLLFLIYFKYQSVSSEIESRNEIGSDLGINIPYWGTSFIKFDNTVTLFRNEGEINASLKLSDKSANLLTDQIAHSKYFSQKQIKLFYTEDNKWPEQDSIKYWAVRSYLEKRKLTGLWAYNSKKAIYDFYEPSLSDIPNAAIMFEQDHVISAEFNPKTKILTYRKFQY
ncbi:hypothetical protein [Daejeonella sp.]|jgi:hypothetical protein|uniref:hypothetical protein n=1 Tax=Daejeonella sp. TaxID=2805397 RepID=UPI003783F68A